MNREYRYQLSCIVPIYNVEEYLEECLESLLKTPRVNMEVILVDDGSTDLSGDIADRYALREPFIKVIHQSNQGLAVARNRGLEVANGDYVVFIDSDDWVDLEQLSKLYQKAEEVAADMVLGTVLYVNPDGNFYSPFLPLPESVTKQVLSGKDCFTELFLASKFVPMATSYLYRRSWLENNNLYFEDVLHEDELWSVEALCLADRIVCTEFPFYYYRQRTGSIMNTLDAGKRLNNLLYIANRLLCFAERFDVAEERIIWSLLYAKSAQLYKLAFWLLDKKRDSRFRLVSHSLYQIYHKHRLLTAEVRSLCLSCFRIANKKLKNYHSWRVSAEVTGVPKVIPNEVTVILFHNRMWETPLIYPKEQVPEGVLITSDQKHLDRADVVVFHLPTLYFDLEGDLDKPEKQCWVGWTLECEENYPFIKSTEFMGLFDYWMSYHQGADIVRPILCTVGRSGEQTGLCDIGKNNIRLGADLGHLCREASVKGGIQLSIVRHGRIDQNQIIFRAEAVKELTDLMALLAGSQIAGVDAVKGDLFSLPGLGNRLNLIREILAGKGFKHGVGG